MRTINSMNCDQPTIDPTIDDPSETDTQTVISPSSSSSSPSGSPSGSPSSSPSSSVIAETPGSPRSPESPESPGTSTVKAKKRILKRRKINLEATLNAYENRIKSLSKEDILVLENAWLSSYDVWDTIPFAKMEGEIQKRHGTTLDNNAYRLFQVATEKLIPIAGITSERQSNGSYIAEIPQEGGRSQTKVVFIGAHNSFCGKKASVFSILPIDKRYLHE